MILELGFDLGKRVELWGFEPQTSCYAMQARHATNLILGQRTDRSRLRSRRTASGADQIGCARRAPGRAGTTGDSTGLVTMTSSADLAHQMPHCEARSCCHGAAIQQEGPTAVPGDQASDLQLPGGPTTEPC